MKNVSLKFGVLFLLALVLSSAVFAQRGQGAMGGGECMIPNLTDEQETQIEKLRTAHQKEVLPLRNQLGEMEAKLRTLTTGDKVDMALVNKQLEDISAVKLQLAKKREAHKQDVRKLLTDDQRVQFDMHSGMGKGRPGKGSMGPMGRPDRPCDGTGPGAPR